MHQKVRGELILKRSTLGRKSKKIKLEQIRAQIQLPRLQGEGGGGANRRLGLQPESGVAHYAVLLSNVLSRVPVDRTLTPGWFEAVEVVFRPFQVPDEIKTVLMMNVYS